MIATSVARAALACLALLGLPLTHVAAQATATRPKAPPKVAEAPVVVPADVAPDSTHPYRPGIDVTHYAFAIRLPKSGQNIEGRATITAMR
ncbi:MAG: hypothetical protein ABJB66_15005, partial [Gemmatimonadaceae bacterium]